MITVTILINNNPIFTRSARNTLTMIDDKTVYNVDTGEQILYKRTDGAVKLAKLMLDTIKEL